MSWIKNAVQVFFISIILFLALDAVVTWVSGSRGFSKFFVHNDVEGRINNPNFYGIYGSAVDPFVGHVTIGENGERISNGKDCSDGNNYILFLGDSTTAGFEVNDEETFVSLFNVNCRKSGKIGVNLGVRAHDTHAVIGSYLRTRDIYNHDTVVYLMTENDFGENINPTAYSNMSKRFGRRYNGQVIKPEDGLLFNVYANLRVFVGDKLSLTTFIISKVPRLLSSKEDGSTARDTVGDVSKQVKRAFELIKNLSTLTSARDVQLYVVPYPALSELIDIYRQERVLSLEKLILKNLPEVSYLNIDELVEDRLKSDNRVRMDMRYRSDAHLSKYGHLVLSEIFMDIFLTNNPHIVEAVRKENRYSKTP